jgi:hypothetical protein
VFILAASSRPTIAEQPLSIEVQSAKSIYLVNETGDDKVLAAAIDQFTSWGRFAISPSPGDADLVITFTHKNSSMDKWGNVGTTKMDVTVKGQQKPVFVTKDSLKLITEPQHPTKACINHFRKRLDSGK